MKRDYKFTPKKDRVTSKFSSEETPKENFIRKRRE
jgi:hypothetical protein